MKKHFIITSALMALFMMASCSEEDMPQGQVSGDFVTFKVAVPQISTRAISDGYTANRLYWGVYDHNGRLLPEISNTDNDGKDDMSFSGSGEVKLTLAQDKKYSIVFWAANESNSMCHVDWDGRCLSVEPKEANQESYDAFCAYVKIDNVSGYKTQEVKLYRPFAQLNIGTADYAKAAASGLTVKNTRIKVSGIPVQYNFVDSTTVGDRTMSYDYPENPVSFKDEKYPVEGYEYLAMNYILVGSDKELVTVKLSYLDDDRQEHERTYTAVPVQRNWRTNIYGNILTSETDFTVTIVPDFNKPDHNIEVWDGKTTEEPKITENTENPGEVVAEITNGAQLAWIAQMLNGTVNNARTTRSGEEVDYSKMTIKLGANIDLGNEQWTSIGTFEKPFSGNLEGNGYTISNLKIVETEAKEGKAYVGFFGYAKDVAIKNVTFDNVYINIACLDIDHSQGHIGAVVGSLEGASTIENVTVKGDIKVEATFDANGASRVAVVAGGNTYGDVTMKNVKVEAKEGSYLKANNNTGALAGQLQGKAVFENCSSNINVTVKKFFAGGIIGLTAGDSKFTNCHTTGDVAVVAGREGRHNDEYRVGGIAGGWADGAKNVCTLNKCSYTGKLSGTNADGSVAEEFDYMGYVGRGYTLNGCQGSTVVIDGVSFVQAGNTAAEAGVYLRVEDGKYYVTSVIGLKYAIASAKDGEIIELTNGITFTEANRTHNSGTWYDGIYYIGDKNFTIDLGGFTISHDGSVNDYLLNFKNDGAKANTITLKNGTLDAGTTAYCALATSSSNAQKITINLEDINLINNISNGAVVKARGGSELNVKAGTIITAKDSYVGIEAVGNNTVVNIYDGAEIYQNGTSNYVGAIVGASYNATMNIYGGKGKSAKCGIIVMSTGATINVSGGEWMANGDGTIAGDNQAVLVSQNNRYESGWACKSVLNVTGGTFKGGYNCYGMGPGVEADDAQINIKGGNFNANPAQYVVAGYEATEDAGNYTVGKPQALVELEEAIAKGGNVTLSGDVTLLESLKIENTVVLDLNGKTITAPLFSAFEVKAGGDLTIKNGKVVAYESTVRAIGGKATIESGEYTSTGTALDSPATYRYSLDCREGGELVINGGTFKSNNGMINVSSTVTINGGKFENIVEKTMTRHFAYVSAPLIINDGEFYGKANGSAGGCFFCGAAAGGEITVNGGKFTSLWTSGSANRIFEVYYGGSINVTGGMFNTNGGIAGFVTENTDEATKAAYPYVAK